MGTTAQVETISAPPSLSDSEERLRYTVMPQPVRFPLALPLRYKAMSENTTILGGGHTEWIGSREIAFMAGEGMEEQMKAKITVAWPFLLDNQVRLQLAVEAVVTRIEEGVAEARILSYDFRTRGEGEFPENPAGKLWICERGSRSVPIGAAAQS
jgi:hypothetical protein